jgi:hypothetical protein
MVDLVRKFFGVQVPPDEDGEHHQWQHGIYSRLDRAQAELQAVREAIRLQAEAERGQHGHQHGG